MVSAQKPYAWREGEWQLGAGFAPAGQFPLQCRRLRFRRQAQHPAHAGLARLRTHRGAGQDAGCRCAGNESRRRLPVQWPRRSGALRLRHRSDSRISRTAPADLRHLPRPSVDGSGGRRQDTEDEVRPPWRQPSGQGSGNRAGDDHQPEPRLCGRSGDACRPTCGDPRIAVRRQPAGHGPDRPSGLLFPGPSRSEPRPARCGLSVRPLHRNDGVKMPKRTDIQSASSSSAPARSSSARPASSTIPAPRPARRCAKRATGSSWSTPIRRRS